MPARTGSDAGVHVRVRCLQAQHRTRRGTSDGTGRPVRFVPVDRLEVGRRRSTSPGTRRSTSRSTLEPLALGAARAGAGHEPLVLRVAGRHRGRSRSVERPTAYAGRARHDGARRRCEAAGSGSAPRPAGEPAVVGACSRCHGREPSRPWGRPASRPRRDVLGHVPGGRPHHAGGRRRHASSPCSIRPMRAGTAAAGCHNDGMLPRADRRRRRGAVLADHPLRPPGGGPREPRRPLRRHRDRRDPGPAGADPDRRGEGRGPGHRPAAPRPSSTAATTMPPEAWERLHGTVRPGRARRSGRPGAHPPDARAARGGTRRPTRRSTRGPTRSWSAGSRWARAPWCGCAPRRVRRPGHLPRRA